MRATKVYAETTARGISVKTLEWISELVERFGDDEVAEAITAEGPRGEMKGLIGRVRDRLAKEAIQSMRRPTPPELTKEQLVAWVRFDQAPASFPVTYDPGRIGLSVDEYTEVVAWAVRGRRPKPAEAVA
jgi:hypothetical protein